MDANLISGSDIVISKMMRTAALAPLLVLCACGGGDSPAAPTGFNVLAGDSRALVTWDYLSNLTYYLWWKKGSSVSVRDTEIENDPSLGSVLHKIINPTVVSAWSVSYPSSETYYLDNGQNYSFIMNATNDGGAAGPSTPVKTVTPAYSGSSWTQVSAFGSVDMKGVASNASIIAGDGDTKTNPLFVAVGAGGVIYTASDFDADGLSKASKWTAVSSGTTTNLNAVAYGVNSGDTYYFVAVGDAGKILYCNYDDDDDAKCTTWSSPSSVPTLSTALNDVTTGSALYVAVGDGGVILTSSDGTGTWTSRTSGTTANLYGVAYLNSTYIAVGAGGTILTSSDGVTWTSRTSGTTNNLYAVTYGLDPNSKDSAGDYTYYFVAVGASGTVLTADGDNSASTSSSSWTWVARASGTTADLYSVDKGMLSRFIAVGANGTVIYSTVPTSWTAASSSTSKKINKVFYVAPVVLASYMAVGVGGTNLITQ